MRQSLRLILPDAAATEVLGHLMARLLPQDCSGWKLLLQGELGAGKSSLARAMLLALGHRGAVPSPTYTLVEPYELAGRKIYHVDLYRLSDGSELPYLGWDDLDDGLLLIEWPERARDLARTGDLSVNLSYADDGREVVLEALSDRGETYLAAVTGALAVAGEGLDQVLK